MLQLFYDFIEQSWIFFNDMSIYLLFGFLIAGLLHIVFPDSFIYKHLGKSTVASVLKSTMAGIPLPLCSCGVIPVAASIRKRGASKGATLSFLIATPQIGTDSFLITYSLIGWVFAVFRIAAAFITALFSGIAANFFAPDSDSRKQEVQNYLKNASKQERSFKNFFSYIFVELFGAIANYLLIGIIAAGLIAVIIPDSFFELYLSSPFLSMLVMLIIGIPIYICATSSTPIAASLLLKGISPGAALVFLLAGPATNTVTISTVLKTMGKRALVIYLGSISVISIALGYILNLFIATGQVSTVMEHQHEMLPEWLKISGAILLMIMFLIHYFLRYNKKEEKNFMSDIITLKVNGMNCQHCSETVRKAVESVEGADNVYVDLKGGLVRFTVDKERIPLIKNAISGSGYEVTD